MTPWKPAHSQAHLTTHSQNSVDREELERYLRVFQQNPDSRVFAPLCDLYRRLGRLQEAEQICREGIRRHPYYAGGKVALAHILLDSHRFDEARSESESVVTFYPDNLLARKILIKALAGLGELHSAKKEFDTLRGLAPLIASDPELERALQGPATSRDLPVSPLGSKPPGLSQNKDSKYLNFKENKSDTPNSSPLSSTVIRAQKLHKLLRKKVLLETWLRTLGSAPSLR